MERWDASLFYQKQPVVLQDWRKTKQKEVLLIVSVSPKRVAAEQKKVMGDCNKSQMIRQQGLLLRRTWL